MITSCLYAILISATAFRKCSCFLIWFSVPRDYDLGRLRSGIFFGMARGEEFMPRDKFLLRTAHDGIDSETATKIFDTASNASKKWAFAVTDFLTPPEYRSVEKIFSSLVEIKCSSWGGFPEAERRRLIFYREGFNPDEFMTLSVSPIEIGGQFLFDMAQHRDYLGSILNLGIERSKIGDILVQGERGAQILCHPDITDFLCLNLSSVRSVSVAVSKIPLSELKVTESRKKVVTSSEASLRLDAVCSAGIGLSRSRVVDEIKNGSILLNWREVRSPSAEVKKGDMITVRGRGRVEIVDIVENRKGRYRITMNKTD